jgi:7-cyano-7-deazaguanine synthase
MPDCGAAKGKTVPKCDGPAPRRETAVVLVSGGMDSCVTTAVAASRGYDLALLHANYGQRTEARELASFERLAAHFGAQHKLVADLRHLARIGGSSLTDARLEVPTAGQAEQPGPAGDGIPTTYVPFRNTNLVAVAVSWAEVLAARRVFIGIVEEDAAGYPDCRKVWLESMNRVVRLGTRPGSGIRVEAPLVGLRKAEIVRLGAKLGAPLELTWSCYRRQDVPCGDCLSCALRRRAFDEAGVRDPLLGD